MLRFIKLCFPFTYFQETRLNTGQSLVFHAWYEWIAGILVLAFATQLTVIDSAYSYLIGYLPFIALYEIGYIVNDFYASRNEENPRLRLQGKVKTDSWKVWVWIAIRLALAVWLVQAFDLVSSQWIIAAIILQVIFGLHNFLKEKEFKVVTFIGLALLRFVFPLIPFLNIGTLNLILPMVLVNYVLYRSINYLASKDLLLMKHRKEAWFKLSFYLLLIPVNALFFITSNSYLPLILNGLYLVFWTAYYLVSKLRVS